MPNAVSSESLQSKSESWKMFNRIAPTYDLLNRFLSGGVDQMWRRDLANHLPSSPERLDLLDVATGTGDQLIELIKSCPERFASATGVDPAVQMLDLAMAKSFSKPEKFTLSWLEASALNLPFADASFDLVTISFGIRNVEDFPAALLEIRRVLRPGGRVLVLEFSLPANPFVRCGYLFYFRHLLPWIGGLVSGRRDAYVYLNRTVEEFPCGEVFLDRLRSADFKGVRAFPYTFGIATLYSGDAGSAMGAAK